VFHCFIVQLVCCLISVDKIIICGDSGSEKKLLLLRYSKQKKDAAFTRTQTTTVSTSFNAHSAVNKMVILGTGKDAIIYVGVNGTIYRISMETVETVPESSSCNDKSCVLFL